MRTMLVSLMLACLSGMSAGLALSEAATASPSLTSPSPDPTLAALGRLNGKAFDVAFMQAIVPHHEEAVEVSMAATLNADHTDVLKWNQKMVERKNAQVRQLLGWLRELNAPPTRRNVGVATASVKLMRSRKGAALEQAYLPLMAGHLERGVGWSRLAATRATHPGLKTLAQEIVKVEEQEAKMLRGWLRAWYAR